MAVTTAHAPYHGTRKWVGLGVFGLAALAAAGIGVLGVVGTVEEYQRLNQPSWAPPSWLFGPVWTVLYAMIAVSGWLVWQKVGVRRELAVYAVQLALNAIWTPIFFGAGLYGLALVDIAVLWVAICATVALFGRVSKPAALLLLPYWAWVSFATALNTAIWYLN